MTIHEKLSKIQFEFKANKSRFNSFGKYNFRSAEDILEALKPFNEKYNVYFTVSENIVSWSGGEFPILESIATIFDADTAMFVTAKAIVGVDLDQKGMQMPQKFGSASSYGKKYALGNLLLIDDTQDADATNTHGNNSKAVPSVPNPGNEIKTVKDAAYNKAVDYLKSGGKLDTIKSKYKLSKAVQDSLEKLTL